MEKIHPTAVVHADAKLAESVEVGPGAVVEAEVEIGEGTVIRPHAVVRRYTIMGSGNFVDSFSVLGGEPQDFKFNPATVSYLRIGNGNTFREGVTISRATTEGHATIVGNHTYWMTNSHAGHDCTIEDDAILVNGALVAGHCTIGRGAILPANGAIHQFCWIGEAVMFQGAAKVSMHVPPFVMCAGDNNVVSLNAVGLRRSPGISAQDRKEIKTAFQITYRSGLGANQALVEMDAHEGWGEPAVRFREFVRRAVTAKGPYRRGLCPHLSRIAQRHGAGHEASTPPNG